MASRRDRLPDSARGRVRGRGTSANPIGRFDAVGLTVEGEYLDALAADQVASGGGSRVATEILRDEARSVINAVDAPDLPFRWTVNPYRGCEHGCIYCYARPGHEYFTLSSGLDFETRIFAKHDAPALLRQELARPRWGGEPIMFSGVTDPYQPVERELRITRGCLEACAEARQPASIITKSRLVERDLDLLSDLARDGAARVVISLTTLDAGLAARMEPRASSPAARLEAIRRCADAGAPVMAMTAPIIPGINAHEIPALLSAARGAGATNAAFILLRLPGKVEALFLDWLSRHFPDRAARVESLIRQTRGGALSDSRYGSRFKGQGPVAEHIARIFRLFAGRLGLNGPMPALSSAAFLARRESGGAADPQGRLFG